MNEIGILGRQIRDLRKAKGVTLQDLASNIDRSLGWLSQIERGISPVSISALDAIAQALGVELSWFFAPGAPPDPEELGMVVRKRHRRVLDFYGSGVHEELLTPTFGNQLLLMETTFAPGSSTGDRDRERRGDEAGLVIRGTLQLSVEGRTLLLKAGDSFAFNRKGPHRCHNPGKTPTVVLWVVTPPSY
jgi:transcriptional regulator with XRE-family HTH domain